MGVLNVTPDSFADGGQFLDPGRAVDAALAMQDAGADLIDVGGESTRPGAAEVPADEERRRIEPVLERVGERDSEHGIERRVPGERPHAIARERIVGRTAGRTDAAAGGRDQGDQNEANGEDREPMKMWCGAQGSVAQKRGRS